MKSRRLAVGVNYPWRNYGWDFGPPPRDDAGVPWGERAAWRGAIDEELAALTRLGVFCVRWFLLGDGTGQGAGDGPRRPGRDAGARGDIPLLGAGALDDVPPLATGVLEDFAHLLDRCRHAGLQLLPSLIDYRFCLAGRAVPGSSSVLKGGRGAWLREPALRGRFLERVLAPLLAVARRHQDVLYAFEIVNEPEWCTRRPRRFDRGDRTVPLAAMRGFLRAAASMVNDAGLRSTVGFAEHATLAQWDSPALHLTLHQFHYYGGPARVPPHDFDPRWPLIVGEMATARHRPWPDLGAAQDVESRLAHLDGRGYPAAFLWSAGGDARPAADPAVDFSPENRARVRRFTGAGAPSLALLDR